MRSLPIRAMMLPVVLLLAATACAKSSTPKAGAPSQTSAPSATASASSSTFTIGGMTANNKGTANLSGKSIFTLDLDNDNGLFYFEPTVLKGMPGEKITLLLKNVGSTKHNFTLESEKVNDDVNTPGTSTKVTISFPQSGSVQFHCEYHESLGMIGELVVGSSY